MSISLKHLYTTGQTITESELALLQRLQKQAKPMSFFVLLEDQELKVALVQSISLTILAAQSRGLVRRRYGHYMVLTQRGLLALNLHAAKTTKHAVIKQAIVQQELFPESLVIREGSRIYTTSLKVAEHFGKEHHNVLKAITKRLASGDGVKINGISKKDGLKNQPISEPDLVGDGLKIEPISEPDLVKAKAIADFLKLHVELSHYIDKYGRQKPMYLMTEQGFNFVTMSFTGLEADYWKIDFINAFHDTKAELEAIQKRYLAALDTIRPSLRPVVDGTQQGQSRLAIGEQIGKSPAAITYHRRVAKKLGLLVAQ